VHAEIAKHDVPATQQTLEPRSRDIAGETIRVAVNVLDKLMTLVGELVLARNQLLQVSNTVEDMERTCQEEIPLHEAEHATMGFTHCETGFALAEKWKLADDIMEVIAHHHLIEQSLRVQPLVALVHLSDLLCHAWHGLRIL
jgi:chemotaxis protein histidine kinase CheA